jgi:hypothetical protein
MTLRIRSTQYQAAGGTGSDVDTYSDRIVKYIPADVVSAWVAIKALVAAAAVNSKGIVLWVCFAAAVVVAAVATLKRTSAPGKPAAITQTAIATGAFIVWVIALGEPFASLLGAPQQSLYGGLLLIFYTIIAGLITPKEG